MLPAGITEASVSVLFHLYGARLREKCIERTLEILSAEEFVVGQGEGSFIFPMLPYIGCGIHKYNKSQSSKRISKTYHAQIKPIARFAQGVDYETITVSELEYYGFEKTRVRELIPAYKLGPYFRQHVIHSGTNVIVTSYSGDVHTINPANIADMQRLQGESSARIYILPKGL